MTDTSLFRHLHPCTGQEFDYEHLCATCKHHTTRTTAGRTVHHCSKGEPSEEALRGEQRGAWLACALWERRGDG